MLQVAVRTEEVFPCCLEQQFPAEVPEGTILPCHYHSDDATHGLKLVTRSGKLGWEARARTPEQRFAFRRHVFRLWEADGVHYAQPANRSTIRCIVLPVGTC
jgi:hypothetical protein